MPSYAVFLLGGYAERLMARDGPLGDLAFLAFLSSDGAVVFHEAAFERLAAIPDGGDYRVSDDGEYHFTMWIEGYAHVVSPLFPHPQVRPAWER